ncbi:SRPBCC domain-containing protein [Conexibacter sp. JD483]|uniref:SRPBCC family protein n=1 Tax=unclassified Conexibacter TaxID=2627773 RepID=UPI002728F783|nr:MULTISPECIES: SRPBCC domain-containing protein [unclassified Conexibacter]MDO8184336.1 SRPBCC domain-containing protein [Conexibacter sp. CPCC 205706]MDO8197642.1 SRPBCC domain-containing protein [Conexibacter sp. CPCC 205762]MDR9368305.1 SRPBCC domain-containing protein [Conexibacter sp. JD483]
MSAESAAAVHRAVVLPISREQAWAAVTDPDQLACWLADEVELDPREGGAARFAWDDGSARVGVVDAIAERRRIAFRWRPQDADGGEGAGDRAAAGGDPDDPGRDESLVELTLDDVEGGTRVSVVEVRIDVLAGGGDVPLAPAGVPSAWTQRMGALSACSLCAWS